MTERRWVLLLAGFVATSTLACGPSEPAETPEEPAAAAAPEPTTRPSVPPETAPHWDYSGDIGPATWGGLSPEFSACGEGQRQSPIDISGAVPQELPATSTVFRPASLRIVHHEHMSDAINNGHTVQVNYPGGDELTLGDTTYELLQYHFHSPSEHTVDGMHYPMEMHLVHRADDGSLAVIGVLIEEGEHNNAFDSIWSNLPQQKGIESHFEHLTVDVGELLPSSDTTYRYDGSLTTPPCSEGVAWLVMTAPIQMSPDQIAAMSALIAANNRPVQPLNGRTIATDHAETATEGE